MLEFELTQQFAKTMFLNNAHRTLHHYCQSAQPLLYSGHAHKLDNLITIWRLTLYLL